ncbi:MAG TPA: type 1 glutamine amidotransferase domain-containing protein [Ktedonobacterales bacterium]|jgi:protease I|nr:type 1 glutamine amidotransferase domain-containing protein [Ktedonobacterales bacterium]
MSALQNERIAILATDGFEEVELTEPARVLGAAGAKVDIIAPHEGRIQAFKHHDKSITVPVDHTIEQARPEEYDALVLPGGALNADEMRTRPEVQRFVHHFADAGKPMAAICHAPWELVSSDLVRGRTLTSWPTLQDDVRNAGGTWVDREVVVDGNLVTSRGPHDLPAFNREMVKLFASRRREANPGQSTNR